MSQSIIELLTVVALVIGTVWLIPLAKEPWRSILIVGAVIVLAAIILHLLHIAI